MAVTRSYMSSYVSLKEISQFKLHSQFDGSRNSPSLQNMADIERTSRLRLSLRILYACITHRKVETKVVGESPYTKVAGKFTKHFARKYISLENFAILPFQDALYCKSSGDEAGSIPYPMGNLVYVLYKDSHH